VIQSYGWSERLQRDFAAHADAGLTPARVLVQHRSGYRLATPQGEADGVIAGGLLRAGELPATGDWVAVEAAAPPVLRIRAVLPRSTAFVRKAAFRDEPQVVAANVDVALLVASLNADFNLRRIERYLATAYESGAWPAIVLTKCDLSDNVASCVAEAEAIAFGVPVLAVSAVTGEGLPALGELLKPGRTAVLLGSSGAGKSTLVNALAGRELMATAAIREDDAHGRHTTTHRELIRLPSGALILDTPGMRELGLWDADAGVALVFEDVEALFDDCRFSDCSHHGEPGCAVRAALDDGRLDPGRWRSYEKLQAELAYERRKTDPEAAAEHRRHWAQIHKAAKARMKAKYGRDG
jgi:ribosome biogenesis GTPase